MHVCTMIDATAFGKPGIAPSYAENVCIHVLGSTESHSAVTGSQWHRPHSPTDSPLSSMITQLHSTPLLNNILPESLPFGHLDSDMGITFSFILEEERTGQKQH